MISECFIIVSNTEKEEMGSFIENIKLIFNIKKVTIIHEFSSTITIKDMIDKKLVHSNNPNIVNNSINKLVKSSHDNNFLSLDNIKHYIQHIELWQYIVDNNLDNILVVDSIRVTNTRVTNARVTNTRVTEKLAELENLNKLYGYLGLCEETQSSILNHKCNDTFFYTNLKCKNTSNAYIIKKDMCTLFLDYAFPMKAQIDTFIGDISCAHKKGYSLKLPIFTHSNKPINYVDKRVPSQGTKKGSIHTVCIIDDKDSDETYVKNIKILQNIWNKESHHVLTVTSEAEALAVTSKLKNNTDMKICTLVIESSIIPKKEHVVNMTKNIPESAHFIGLTTKRIEHPFEFNNELQYVHPHMPNFKVYLLTPHGAELLLRINSIKNSNKNLILSREGFAFAHTVDE